MLGVCTRRLFGFWIGIFFLIGLIGVTIRAKVLLKAKRKGRPTGRINSQTTKTWEGLY